MRCSVGCTQVWGFTRGSKVGDCRGTGCGVGVGEGERFDPNLARIHCGLPQKNVVKDGRVAVCIGVAISSVAICGKMGIMP